MTVESFKLHIMSKSSINSRYVQKTATRGGPRADPGFFHGIFGHFLRAPGDPSPGPPGTRFPSTRPSGEMKPPAFWREGGMDSMGRKGISYRSLVVSTNQPTLKKPLKSTSRSFSLKIDRGNELKKIELPPKFTFRFTVYIQAECTYSIHRSNGKKVDVDS